MEHREKVHVLAHTHVRPLLEDECQSVRDAAERVRRSAEEGHVDAEAVHDYRVALRRLRTLLAAAAPLFRREPLRRVRDGLRELAHAAGAVRDEEVLAETLAGFELPAATHDRVDAWLRGRARRERRLRADVVDQLAGGDAQEPDASDLAGLLDQVERLPLRKKAAALSTRALAIDALRDAARKTVKQAERPDAETPAERHRLRIRWKRVRYTAELFSSVLASDGPAADELAHLVKTATRMQKRLGEMHDLDEAIARVTRARQLGAGDRMVVHHQLRTARAELSERLAKELPEALALLTASDGAWRLA